ncbi:MAG: hypothetical protein HKN26_15160 [Acidimicrobiales bacterium]|nr:hypothetical protein [Acidimicrobiales bacterium]
MQNSDQLGAIEAMLDRHWVPEGYAAPNEQVYPWQWLWDSCFHVVIWAALGRPERAVTELTQALSTQDAHGFVPHMNYQRDPGAHADLWGRTDASSITQPPMYGHAIAELRRRGNGIGTELLDRARWGLQFLLADRRRHRTGLVELCHPWETGADDSPRWDDMCPGDGFDLDRWRAHKSDLVAAIERNGVGSPIANPEFPVASIGFNALLAFNCFELAEVDAHPETQALVAPAAELVSRIEARWDAELTTWIDAGPTEAGSGRTRSLDAMLGLLVVEDPAQLDAGFAALLDPAAYGAPYGPAGVHRAEAMFAPRTYWRGPAWPQLSYLLWVAARRQGRPDVAETLGGWLRDGAAQSGLAEYWDPDDGTGLGAIPQSWAGLAALVA